MILLATTINPTPLDFQCLTTLWISSINIVILNYFQIINFGVFCILTFYNKILLRMIELWMKNHMLHPWHSKISKFNTLTYHKIHMIPLTWWPLVWYIYTYKLCMYVCSVSYHHVTSECDIECHGEMPWTMHSSLT
jgi:hypothetical protein